MLYARKSSFSALSPVWQMGRFDWLPIKLPDPWFSALRVFRRRGQSKSVQIGDTYYQSWDHGILVVCEICEVTHYVAALV